MRRLSQRHPLKHRGARRAEWNRYATHPLLGPEVFGMSVRAADEIYTIDGWLQRNPVYPIYAIRESDGEAFALRIIEVDDTLMQRNRAPP